MDNRQRASTPEPAATVAAPEGTGFALVQAEIHAAARQRRERGDLPPDERLDAIQGELWAKIVAAPVGSDAAPTGEFTRPAPPDLTFTLAECDLLPDDYSIAWRYPVVGHANAAIRRQINAEVRQYVDPALARQTRLNYRLTELLQRVASDQAIEVQRLRDELDPVGGLRAEVDALRAEAAALRAALAGLRAETAAARDELRRARADAPDTVPVSGARAGGDEPELPIDYLAYNERIGGTPEHARALYAGFLSLFAAATGPVADLGCGRGPFLDLLRDAGIARLGVDRSPEMVAYVGARGHRAVEADALDFVEGAGAGTLGGIFVAHLIEHLSRAALVRLVGACRRALAPGGYAVFISPDPRSLFVLSDTFYKDLTHVAPVHPAALAFLVEQAGFAGHELRTLSPVPAHRRLEGEDAPGAWTPALRRNLGKVEDLLFGDLDYALVARR